MHSQYWHEENLPTGVIVQAFLARERPREHFGG